MLCFTPATEEELKREKLLPEGIYPFDVVSSEHLMSKSGNNMIKINLKIWDDSGNTYFIWDYLLENIMKFKLKHFCDSVRLADKYLLGRISADDCLGRSGYVEIIIDKEKPNPNGGMYPAKNVVKDYVFNKPEPKPINTASILDDFKDDDVPF